MLSYALKLNGIKIIMVAPQGRRTRWPKFKFSPKNILRFTRDFANTEKKNQNLIESDAQNYFYQKSVEVQPCTSLKIILDSLYF